nr:glycosyltransferase family 4 protein [uncultured Desulfobacter sp.]
MTDQQLTILWITERYPPMVGGMAVSAHRQVTALRRKGFRVDVMILQNRPGEKAVSVARALRDGGRDMVVSHPDTFGNAAQRAWREVMACHHETPYDLLVGFGACMPGYTAVTWAAFLGVASLVSVRGNDFDRDWFEPKRGGFVQEAIGRASRIAVVAEEKAAKIRALFPGKAVFWCPNGVEPARFNLLPAEQDRCRALRSELNANERRIIGLFGEFKYKKRVPDFLAAIREQGLKDKVCLLITGRMDEECHALMDDPVLSPASRHFSFRNGDQLAPLYGACDFMAIPSLFEGFPNVLLEAMAAGVVPIVSDAGAMGDVIVHGQTGFVFPALDRKACGRALTQALSLSDEALDTLKQRVKTEVRDRFSVEKEGDILAREIINTIKGAHAYRHADKP